MNLQEAKELADTLLQKVGLKGWELVETQDKTLKRLGWCDYLEKRIHISDWAFRRYPKEVENTVRHEVAHAATPGKDHNLTWKAMARNLGADPVACFVDGIPMSMQSTADENEEEPKEKKDQNVGAYVFKDEQMTPVRYYVTVEYVNGEYVCKHGSTFIHSCLTLEECTLKAIEFCDGTNHALLINFANFVMREPVSPI